MENYSINLAGKLNEMGFHGDLEICLLYTSDAADDLLCVDLGGRRIIKKKKINKTKDHTAIAVNTRYLTITMKQTTR